MEANILVVDDEPEIADLVEVYLQSEGCTVYKCNTGTQALAVVNSRSVDLAILDVMLPDISGFTLCGEIRKDHHFPVLMLTAKAEDMDKITGLTIGADDYITKPFNPLELMARVKAQLRRYTRYNEALHPLQRGGQGGQQGHPGLQRPGHQPRHPRVYPVRQGAEPHPHRVRHPVDALGKPGTGHLGRAAL